MTSIKACIYFMARHIKSMTLDGPVGIHGVCRIEHPVPRMEHPIHR